MQGSQVRSAAAAAVEASEVGSGERARPLGRVIATGARLLLGLMFTVFGLNGFLHFIHMPPPPEPAALQFFGVMVTTHYMDVVFAVQLVCGVLLLAGLFVPLALIVLAPVIVNILLFHITMNPEGMVTGAIAAVLWGLAVRGVWPAFAGLLRARQVG
jgi:uncharacterized membrane protein YphA (DoxX/SURF4 family)